MNAFVTLIIGVLSLTSTTLPLCSAASVELNKDNFEQLTKGKTVFIKLYAPWCGHCQTLAPEWEKMAAEWEDHPQGLVAEVNCAKDEDAEDWCEDVMGVQGLPTILYGDASAGRIYLNEYRWERTYDVLSEFAKDTLKEPYCSPSNVKACDKKTQKEIKGYLKMSEAKMDKEIEKKEKLMEQTEENFEKSFDKMQDEYDITSAAYETNTAAIRSTIRMLKEVKEMKQEAS